MNKINFTFITLFIISFSVKAQKNNLDSKHLPTSIYTFNSFTKDTHSFSSINKKLNLTNFEFVYAEDLDYNQFTMRFKNIGKTPSEFIYDDYNSFQNNNLLKGFLMKYDPTRWNLHRCQNKLLPRKN